MDIYVAWTSDIETRMRLATTGNKPEEVRKLSFSVEKANMVVESWLLTSGGKLIGYEGNIGTATVPADRLGELPELRERYGSAIDGRCFIGIGTELREASQALMVARKRGGKQSIVFYTPDLAAEADEQSPERSKGEENSPGDLSDADALLLDQPLGKGDFGNEPSAGEATQVAAGAMSPSAAQPSPLPMAGPSALPGADPSASASPSASPAGAPAPANTGQGDKSAKLKEAVVSVLKDIRAQTPTFEKLKEENPKAYEAVMELVSAMLDMAKQLLGQNGQPVQKSMSPDALRADCKACKGKGCKTCQKDAVKVEPAPEETPSEGLNKDQLPAAPGVKGVTATGHHNVILPPGSMHNGKVKVIHSDGSASWSSQRSGRVPADAGGHGGDAMMGHSMPSRHPSDSHSVSGEAANNPVAAQVQKQ